MSKRLRAKRAAAVGPATARWDSWLQTFFGEQLEPIESECATRGPAAIESFRRLPSHVWALLLTQEYGCYPAIKAVLPDVPEAELQATWNGTSGASLAAQGVQFYDRLRERYGEYSAVGLQDSAVLDFGCGWGRLTRMFARDVRPGALFGCDPAPLILDLAERNRVPATFARSEHIPERIPFEQSFELAFAFSVFTHLSERAHIASLRALHHALRPGGILVVTIRPAEYLWLCELLAPVLAGLGPEPRARLVEPLYLFTAHDALPLTPRVDGQELSYGETVVTLAYVRERWADLFELLCVDLLLVDPYQMMLTLRARPPH